MTYRILIVICFGAFGLIYTGCESSDTPGLEGSWSADSLTFNNSAGLKKTVSLGGEWVETLTLNADGTYSYGSTQLGSSRSGSGNWSKSQDGILVLTGENLSYSLEGDSLIVNGSVPEGDYQLRYKKISK